MRTIYAIQLQIIPREGESPTRCFGDLINRLREWVKGKYQRTWNTSVSIAPNESSIVPIEGHTLRVKSSLADDWEFFTLDWSHPSDHDSSTTWVTSCIVARRADDIEFATLVRISTTRTVIRPVRFDLGRPRLVSDLLAEYPTLIDGWPVPRDIERIASTQVQGYVDNVLLNANRNLPVIAISPDVWNGRYLVDASTLFQRVMGFAHVAVLADKWTAFKLTDVVGKPLSCFDGAVRIYWPGFALDDNPLQHKRYLEQSIRIHEYQGVPLADQLFRMLTAVASYRYTEGATIRDVRHAIADSDQRRFDELRNLVQTGSLEKDSLETQLLHALERIDLLIAERDQYKSDLAAQHAAWAEVQQTMAPIESATDQPTSDHLPRFNSVAAAVEQAKKDFSSSLIFLDSALESASDSPFKAPERVYELFEALALVATEWREKNGSLGQSWSDAVAELGFDLRDQVSMTSKGKYADDYKFMYKGQRQLFEKHITIGAKQADKCLSVHWHRDDDDLVLVIGHCGRHLSNTTS